MRCGSLLFRHGAGWNIDSCVWPTASYAEITVHLQKTLELSTLSFRPGVGKNTAFFCALPTVTDIEFQSLLQGNQSYERSLSR